MAEGRKNLKSVSKLKPGPSSGACASAGQSDYDVMKNHLADRRRSFAPEENWSSMIPVLAEDTDTENDNDSDYDDISDWEDANPVEAQNANNAHDIEFPPGMGNNSDSQDNDDDDE